jgi:hypothetical protein
MTGSTVWGTRIVKTRGKAILAAGILVHLVLYSSLSFRFLNPLAVDTTHRRGQGVDFYAVYQAGRNIIDGVSIYADKPQNFVVPYNYPFRYHPFVALTVGLASNLVTPAVAYTLWVLLQEILLAVNVLLTRKLFDDPLKANIASALWLLFFPLYLELYMGQFSFLMASLVFWMIILWQRGKTTKGDVAWTTSLLVKSNTGLLLPVLLKLGWWKVIAVALVVVTVVSAPYFLMVPGSLQAFTQNLSAPLTVPTIAGNQGFAGLVGISWLRLGGLWPDSIFLVTKQLDELNAALPVPVTVWTAMILAVTLAVTVRSRREDWIELLLLWIVVYFLVYKHVWEHQYVMVVPVFVILFWRRDLSPVARAIPGWVFWGSFALAALPTAFVLIDKEQVLIDPEYYWNDAESLLFHLPKPLGMLILFLSAWIALWRNRHRVLDHASPPPRTS